MLNPWLSDLRRSAPIRRVTRIGLEAVPHYAMRSYRMFSIQIFLGSLLLLVSTVTIYCFKSHHRELEKSWYVAPYRKVERDVYSQQEVIVPPPHQVPEQKPKGLIIVSNARSGSKFVGQLFNQRDDTFYLFEPLLPFPNDCTVEAEQRKINHLRDLLLCNIRSQKDIFSDIGIHHTNIGRNNTALNDCLEMNFCYRDRIAQFCRKPLCHQGQWETCSSCEPVDLDHAVQACRAASVRVLKVNRLCNIDNLAPILNEESVDTKILQLVRDPRGTIASIDKLAMETRRTSTRPTIHMASNLCSTSSSNFNSAKNNQSFRNKYKILRYEDMCLDPIRAASRLYSYVGLSMTPRMEKWITANTEGDSSDLGDSRAYRLLENRYQTRSLKYVNRLKPLGFGYDIDKSSLAILLNDPYTTIRKSKEAWKSWYNNHNIDEIHKIETVCSINMHDLGYNKIYKRKKRLTDDFRTYLLRNVCPSDVFLFCATDDSTHLSVFT